MKGYTRFLLMAFVLLCVHRALADYPGVNTEKRSIAKPSETECTSGETKKEDCNRCKCVMEHWACTFRNCDRRRRDIVECQHGQTKMADCNTCSCAKGHWVCTRKFCLKTKRELPTKVLADLKNVPCSPSDTFILDCNRCQCNFERTGYTCVKSENCTITT